MKLSPLLKKIKLDTASRDVVIGISIAALIGANILLTRVPWKLDLSRGKAYSLSDASTKLIAKVKDPIDITLYASADLPAKFLPTKTEVADLLSEYQQASPKITIKQIDPKTDEKEAQKAATNGIPALEFSTVENDQFSVSTGYFGITITSKDKAYTIPSIDTQTLEYNITSAIYKLTHADSKTVGMIGGGPDMSALMGQQGTGESMEVVRRVLSEQFPVEQVDISTIDATRIKPLIVLDGASSIITDENLPALQSYLDAGGNMLLFTDGVSVSNDLVGASASARMRPLLDTFGITIRPELALSAQSEIVMFGAQNGDQYPSQYPYWVRTNVYNPDATYASNIGSLTFPWVSPLSLQKKAGIKQQEIVRSTSQSWTSADFADLKPQAVKRPEQKDVKQSLLIAYAKNEKTKGEIFVIPSSRFAQDQYLGRSGNLDLVVNLVNEFASNGALSGIRARAVQALPLPALSASEKDLFKWGNVLLLPVLFAAYGAYRLVQRK